MPEECHKILVQLRVTVTDTDELVGTRLGLGRSVSRVTESDSVTVSEQVSDVNATKWSPNLANFVNIISGCITYGLESSQQTHHIVSCSAHADFVRLFCATPSLFFVPGLNPRHKFSFVYH